MLNPGSRAEIFGYNETSGCKAPLSSKNPCGHSGMKCAAWPRFEQCPYRVLKRWLHWSGVNAAHNGGLSEGFRTSFEIDATVDSASSTHRVLTTNDVAVMSWGGSTFRFITCSREPSFKLCFDFDFGFEDGIVTTPGFRRATGHHLVCRRSFRLAFCQTGTFQNGVG